MSAFAEVMQQLDILYKAGGGRIVVSEGMPKLNDIILMCDQRGYAWKRDMRTQTVTITVPASS